MKIVLGAAALLLAGFIAAPLAMDLSQSVVDGDRAPEATTKAYEASAVPKVEVDLTLPEITSAGTLKVLTLEARNTVVLKGPVTRSSVAKVMHELRDMSRELPASAQLYLVLDTPGGSVDDGLDLIDFARALPQKVHTVTLFAASMGFQIAQGLDTRYITRTGTLMSHRAKVDGLGGQIKGEFESRYKMIRRSIDYLDFVAAKRMGIDAKKYDELIFNEYWVYGFDAVTEKAADEQVLVKCGASLDGSDTVEFETLFGTATVTFSKCPLIKNPEKIDLAGILPSKQAEVREAISVSVNDEREFVKSYITTDRFAKMFR